MFFFPNAELVAGQSSIAVADCDFESDKLCGYENPEYDISGALCFRDCSRWSRVTGIRGGVILPPHGVTGDHTRPLGMTIMYIRICIFIWLAGFDIPMNLMRYMRAIK